MRAIVTSLKLNQEKDMVDPIHGTESIVGFSHGHNGHGHDGLSGKDASFLTGQFNQNAVADVGHSAQVSAGFQQANSDRFGYALLHAIESNGRENHVATEKTGAATALAVEKIGAAGIVEIVRSSAGTNVAIEKTTAATNLAIEKTSAALNLAIEKTAAATNLAIEKTAAASQLEALRNRSDVLAAIAACCCELKEGQANTNALILSTDASRVKDDLAQCRAELLARQFAGNGNGNNN